MAAYDVLAHVGDASSAALLCNTLNQNPVKREANTILACLRRMSANGADRVIVEALSRADAPTKSLLIRVISDRRYHQAAGMLHGYTRDKNPAVAKAALRAIGSLGNYQGVPDLIDVVLESLDETVAEEAVRAIMAITRRGGNEEYVGELILERLEKVDSAAERCSLMRVLAAAPGVDSLKWLQAASKDQNAQVRDCAVRTLVDYPEATAAQVLLDIFETTENKTHRILSLRGCVRLCKTTDIPAQKSS